MGTFFHVQRSGFLNITCNFHIRIPFILPPHAVSFLVTEQQAKSEQCEDREAQSSKLCMSSAHAMEEGRSTHILQCCAMYWRNWVLSYYLQSGD